MKYRCWTVKCKTEGCGVVLTLDVIGREEKFRHAVLPPLAPFTLTCCECKKPNSYTMSDVNECNVENPDLNFRCREFLEAIEKASQVHSGTAGFNDGDATVVGSVFWHKGGYILDRDGREKDIDPDEPGWYYWYEGPDGFRHLHGPCDTKADAELYLEVNGS